jgi:hypothetical protein
MRSFENIDEDNVEEWPQSDACEVGFQHMRQTLSMRLQNRRVKKRVGTMSGICTAMRRKLNSSQQ